MKIGVFGDSYACNGYTDTVNPKIWFNFLIKNHGHQVWSFGESGSSIMFSAKLIQQHASEYDLVIWCLTTPGRFSFPQFIVNRFPLHISSVDQQIHSDNAEINKIHQACIDYLKYVFDWDTENLIGTSVVNYICHMHKNVMVIPCFPAPLAAEFNLYNLCEKETQHYFPGKTLLEVYQHYNDMRPGHLSPANHEILAHLINEQLEPGIFQTNYSNFVDPDLPLDKAFTKK